MSHDPLIMWSCEITWQTKNISTTRVPMATKLGRTVTNLERLPPIKLFDPLVTWSRGITISSLPLPCYQTWQDSVLPLAAPSYQSTRPFGHVVLQDHVTKVKLLYLHHYSVYDHQTWQVGDLLWGSSIDIITWPFNDVLRDYLTK